MSIESLSIPRSTLYSFEPLHLLEDQPVANVELDHLGLRPFSEVVAGAAVGTPGPFTVGVFADWGEGKTSVLQLAKSLLDNRREEDLGHVITVWFNAWQFEHEEHPIVPLVASIVAALEERRMQESSIGQEALELLAKLSRALRAIARGFSLGTTVAVPGVSEIRTDFAIKEMAEHYEHLAAKQDPLLEQSLYYSAFQLLDEVASHRGGHAGAGSAIPKIVVFIDDLDRCLPDQGLKLLESLKLVLAQPGFVFALAVDRRVLECFLRRRYEKDFGMDSYDEGGRYYLDKLVQLPLSLPAHSGRFQRYIERLLTESTAFQDGRNAAVKGALEELSPILASGADFNPRSLIRFVNNLIVDRSLWAAIRPDEEPDAKLLGLSIVARILRQHLGETIYRPLVHEKAVCEALAGGRTELNEAEAEVEGSSLRSQEFLTQLLQLFEGKGFLAKMLDSEPGQSWLLEHEARQRIHEFLAEERESEVTAGSDTQSRIVTRAIRKATQKDVGELTPQERVNVRSLDFSFSGLNDEGLQELRALPLVERLELTRTEISDAGLVHLSPLSSLRILELRNTRVTDVGMSYLSGIHSLQVLDLSYTPITDQGLVHLSKLKFLQRLFLLQTVITDVGLAALVELQELVELDLSKTRVTDAAVEHLVQLQGLRQLLLSETSISPAGLNKLRASLRTCDVYH